MARIRRTARRPVAREIPQLGYLGVSVKWSVYRVYVYIYMYIYIYIYIYVYIYIDNYIYIYR